MSDDTILKGTDGYIGVERQSGPSTLWSDQQAGGGTFFSDARTSRATARARPVAIIAQRIADGIVKGLRKQ